MGKYILCAIVALTQCVESDAMREECKSIQASLEQNADKTLVNLRACYPVYAEIPFSDSLNKGYRNAIHLRIDDDYKFMEKRFGENVSKMKQDIRSTNSPADKQDRVVFLMLEAVNCSFDIFAKSMRGVLDNLCKFQEIYAKIFFYWVCMDNSCCKWGAIINSAKNQISNGGALLKKEYLEAVRKYDECKVLACRAANNLSHAQIIINGFVLSSYEVIAGKINKPIESNSRIVLNNNGLNFFAPFVVNFGNSIAELIKKLPSIASVPILAVHKFPNYVNELRIYKKSITENSVMYLNEPFSAMNSASED